VFWKVNVTIGELLAIMLSTPFNAFQLDQERGYKS